MRWIVALAGLAVMGLSVPKAQAQAQVDGSGEAAAASAVQRHFDAYRAWNLDRFVATFAPDAIVIADGMAATGHAQIRALYASNFADIPHSIRIVESGMRDGVVFVRTAYTFANGAELCCAYSEYTVVNGKIAFLFVTMPASALP